MSGCGFETYETAWCPGCGNFGILAALKNALEKLQKKPHEVLVVGGIGQAAKTPQYINTNGFCGLHGRAVPPAAAAKIVNRDLTVIVNTGDGDTYGEGGNHLIHNIRRNIDITHFVHDNQIYGLTKGQASPTTAEGHVTTVQALGSKMLPLNPLLLSLVLGAGFVARGSSGDVKLLTEIMEQAIIYKGYAIVDILQPCVSFNKVNTYKWYKERVYRIGSDYDFENMDAAINKASEWGDRIPLGIIYKKERPVYSDKLDFLKKGKALVYRGLNPQKIQGLLSDFM